MKNIKFLFLLVATLFVGAFTACQQYEDWAPGQPDSDLSVYFPVDFDVAEFATEDDDDTVEIDETTTAAFPVYRQNAGTEMTVEIRSRIVNPDAVVYRKSSTEITAAEAFTVAESVTFGKKDQVAYLYIYLNEKVESLSVGSLFEIEIMVKDTAHKGNYGLSRKTFSVGIPETWTDLGAAQTDASLKLGTYRDDFFAPVYGQNPGNVVPVVIEESDARKGVYRMKNLFSQDNMVQIIGGVPSDMSFANGDTYILIDGRNPKSVYIPFQPTGVGIPGYMDNIGIATGASIGAENAVLENGIINFKANTVGLLDVNTGSGMYANTNGLMRITFPGISMKDYSLSVAYAGSRTTPDNSQTLANLDFTVGNDVNYYRFVVVKGNQEAYTKVQEGMNFKTVAHESINQMLAATANADGSLSLPEEYVIPEGEESYVEDAAESAASETAWYVTMPEPEIYTVFAVAFDAEGQPTTDDSGKVKVAKTFFYYHPVNMNHGDQVPDIAPMVLQLCPLSELIGQENPNYPSAFTLGFKMDCADADLITKIMFYHAKTSDLPADVEAEYILGVKDAQDYTSWIPDVKAGEAIMGLNALEPDTEYTAFVSVSSIYGKTYCYKVEAKTTPYAFDVVIGTYKFTDGDSSITFELEPFFSSNYNGGDYNGELYFVHWTFEDNSPYAKVAEFPMIAFRMPAYKAVVCYGQVDGYKGTFFNYNFPYLEYDAEGKATANADKSWGFQSSSTATYDYNYESMVLYYGEDFVINELGTYFRQYVHENDPEAGEGTTTYPLNFRKGQTTVELVESKMPVVEENNDEEVNAPAEQQMMKMGVSREKRVAKLTYNKNLVFESVEVK